MSLFAVSNMMKLLLLFSLVFSLCLGKDHHKEAMMKENKTPKKVNQYNDVCDECKNIVRRFDQAMKDPAKISELKNLLSILCDQTKYVEECKMVVNRLDLVIEELEPYLRNPDKLCRTLHLCSNSEMRKVHRMGLLYAKKYLYHIEGNVNNDVVCDECQFAMTELKTMIEEKDVQAEIQEFLHDYICKYLSSYQGACDELIEQFLPEFFEYLEQLLQNPKEVCAEFGLCSNVIDSILLRGQPLRFADNSFAGNSIVHDSLHQNRNSNRLRTFFSILGRLQTKKGIYMSCFECSAIVNLLLAALDEQELQMTIADDFKTTICNNLPVEFKLSCLDFIATYFPTVLKMTIDHWNENQACSLLHICTTAKYRSILRIPSNEKNSVACESCMGITQFIDRELADSTFQGDVEAEINEYICMKLPDSMQNLCENLVQTYIPKLMLKLKQILNSGTICKDELHMCKEI